MRSAPDYYLESLKGRMRNHRISHVPKRQTVFKDEHTWEWQLERKLPMHLYQNVALEPASHQREVVKVQGNIGPQAKDLCKHLRQKIVQQLQQRSLTHSTHDDLRNELNARREKKIISNSKYQYHSHLHCKVMSA